MADALISLLLEQLASVVFEHTKQAVTHILNAKQDVRSFSSNLKAIQVLLEDAEKKQVTEAGVSDWLQKLKDVSYDMEDVLDEWNTEILRQHVEEAENAFVSKQEVCFPILANCFCLGQVNKAIHYDYIARRIKELNERLNVIAAEKDRYVLHQSTIRGTDEQLVQRQKTSSLVDISTIFGREEELKSLLSKLLRESSLGGQFLIIPILGMGGMGKTTLTQLAYNNEKVTSHFHKKVWVCVSHPFDEIKIAKAIIESLDKNDAQRSSNELETLQQCIKSHVKNKRLLLVLDDVWTEDSAKWDNLKLPVMMKSCEEGSTILVTARKEEVAKMMRATSNKIHLDKLNDSESLALFNSIAFFDREEDESSEFGVIGGKIVKKCKGLPLAIKTLASLVWHKKKKEDWLEILDSKIWELKEIEEQVFQPLLVSYYDLPLTVKRCLLHCAIFPKDYWLEKDKLIEFWMSQNYLNSKKNKEKRRIGESYFESLAMRSFFQDFDRNKMGDVYGCKMHDIVHDFVQFLTQRECIIVEAIGNAKERMELEGDKVRHLALTSVPNGPLDTSFSGFKKIRTLTVLDSKITTISPHTIVQMKCLRTLNLSGNMLNELPNEIGELIHLRYIDLSSNKDLKGIPEAVCDLCNLQTLDLRWCRKLVKLPKAMGKLISLRHLYVNYCKKLTYLPKGVGRLGSLQALDSFYVSEGNDEALKLGDLRMMDLLHQSLWIKRLGKKDDTVEIKKARLGNKKHLLDLVVSFLVDETLECEEQIKVHSDIVKALQPHQSLESLYIRHCYGTSESLYCVMSLQNLRKVWLFDWKVCESLPPLGKLPSLEILIIQKMEKVKKVGVEFLARQTEKVTSAGILFPKLKQLSFLSLTNWEEWEGITKESSESINIMPSLSEFRIQKCPKLKALPDFLYKKTPLRTLEIRDCRILEEEYEMEVGKEWHNVSHIPNFTITKRHG